MEFDNECTHILIFLQVPFQARKDYVGKFKKKTAWKVPDCMYQVLALLPYHVPFFMMVV